MDDFNGESCESMWTFGSWLSLEDVLEVTEPIEALL